MVLCSNLRMGLSFQEKKKNNLKIPHLVAEILGKHPVSLFFEPPCIIGGDMAIFRLAHYTFILLYLDKHAPALPSQDTHATTKHVQHAAIIMVHRE